MQSPDNAYDLITLHPAGTLPIISPTPAVDASGSGPIDSLGYKVLFILFPNYIPFFCCDITQGLGPLFPQIQRRKSNAEARAGQVNLSRFPLSKSSPNPISFPPIPPFSSLSLHLHLTSLGSRHFPGNLYWRLLLSRRDIYLNSPLHCWAAPTFYPHGRSPFKFHSASVLSCHAFLTLEICKTSTCRKASFVEST